MSSTINGTLQHGVILEAPGYTSPTTIAGVIDASSGNAVSALSTWDIAISGNIVASTGEGVFLKAGGFIDNSGSIDVIASYGVFANAQTDSLENSGSIYGGRAGVLMVHATINLDNLATGTIEGGSMGVKFTGANAANSTLLNEGLIESTAGVGIRLGEAVGTNAAGGIVAGGSVGIYVGALSTFTNDGTVAGGTGVLVGGMGVTIIDFGTISASIGNAISFTSNAATPTAPDFLTLMPGAVLVGTASGGGVADVVFAGTTLGTLANVGRELTGFPTISIASGAEWAFSGTSSMLGNVTFENNGTLVQGAGDALTIDSAVKGTGTIELDATTLAIGNTVGSGEIFDFVTGFSTLLLSSNHIFSGTIAGFEAGDTIELTGFGPNASIAGTMIGDVMTLSGGINPTTITFASNPGSLDVVPISGGGTTKSYEIVAPCFRAGTRLLTPDGLRPVESLRKDDLLLTHGGAVRPIIWHGHRRIDCRKHSNPETVRPILIEQGAFGPGLPSRDLYLSPDHALYCESALIPAQFLINGVSIRQVDVPSVTYHHVELASHDVIWAETLPAETYLDCGNRHNFARQGDAITLFPEFGQPEWDVKRAFAPLVTQGPLLGRVRTRLHERLEEQGFRRVAARFQVFVDGRSLSFTGAGSGQPMMHVPSGAANLIISSATSSPAETDPMAQDRRRLGIAIADILADGLPVHHADRRFGAGFYAPEWSGRRWFRWTDGSASFDVSGMQELSFTVQAVSPTWQALSDWNEDSIGKQAASESR